MSLSSCPPADQYSHPTWCCLWTYWRCNSIPLVQIMDKDIRQDWPQSGEHLWWLATKLDLILLTPALWAWPSSQFLHNEEYPRCSSANMHPLISLCKLCLPLCECKVAILEYLKSSGCSHTLHPPTAMTHTHKRRLLFWLSSLDHTTACQWASLLHGLRCHCVCGTGASSPQPLQGRESHCSWKSLPRVWGAVSQQLPRGNLLPLPQHKSLSKCSNPRPYS